MLTIPNALTPSEDEYTIATLLSDKSIQKVAVIQKQLSELFGDAVWVVPSNCLHITLMEIIYNVDYGEMPRKQLFYDWHSQYGELAGEVIGQFPAFSLDFNELLISPSAIIIKASDPRPLNSIRSVLLSKITLPHGTKLPPDIGHSTIARFSAAAEFENVKDATEAIQVKINERIKGLKLIEGLAPPILNPKEIRNYPLRSS